MRKSSPSTIGITFTLSLALAITLSILFPVSVSAQTNQGGGGSGAGTVTSFSAGTLSPLFTTSVATSTTTPALTFSLSNAGAYTVFGNFTGSSAAPGFTAAPTFSAANLTNFPTFNQNTSGTAANLSGTPALPNGTTATTQTTGDNSTKIATDGFVLANTSSFTLASQPYVPVMNATLGLISQQPGGTAPVWNGMGVAIDPTVTNCGAQDAAQERAVMYDPTPIVSGQPFEMWLHSAASTLQISLATSVTGMPGSWNCQGVVLPGYSQPRHVWRDGSGNIVLYASNGIPGTIYKNVSATGTGSWTSTATNITNAADPYIWQEGSTTYALWTHGAAGYWQGYQAVSTDGLTGVAFTPFSGNPFITAQGSGSFAGYKDGSGNYWLWSQAGTPSGNTPTDIYRWKCTNLTTSPSCSANPSGIVYPRLSADENPGSSASQVADPSFVTDGTASFSGTPSVLSNLTYMYYTMLPDQSPSSTYVGKIKMAIANMSLAQLITTNEGRAPVPWPDLSLPIFPGVPWLPCTYASPCTIGEGASATIMEDGAGPGGYERFLLGNNFYYNGSGSATRPNTSLGGGFLQILAGTSNAGTTIDEQLVNTSGTAVDAFQLTLASGGGIGNVSFGAAALCLGGITASGSACTQTGIQSSSTINGLPRLFIGDGNGHTTGFLDFSQYRLAEASAGSTQSGYAYFWDDPTIHWPMFNSAGGVNFALAAGLSAPNSAPTYTKTANATSCAATSGYTNTNTRGNVTVVGGTATTGTICTVNFSTTLSAAPGTVIITETDGGTALVNLSHGVPSTTGFTVTAGLTVASLTVSFDYLVIP